MLQNNYYNYYIFIPFFPTFFQQRRKADYKFICHYYFYCLHLKHKQIVKKRFYDFGFVLLAVILWIMKANGTKWKRVIRLF